MIFIKSILYCLFQKDVEGEQWGKEGPGGNYWRESALTGQGFQKKMVLKEAKNLILNRAARAGILQQIQGEDLSKSRKMKMKR